MPQLPADEAPIPLSAVQHAVYCLRQAALIHLERLWDENRFTAEGDVLHAVADKGGRRKARGVRRVLALPLASVRLNLTGVADLVEFQPIPGQGERPFPVEYKRGKPKLHRADEAQLCAQALCLEEMTDQPVPEGALFYAQTRRRVLVPFDADLRTLTEATVADLTLLFTTGRTPPPTPHRSRCRACSLLDLCRPDTVSRPVRRWRDQTLTRLLEAP
ncbi:CRISPR-associated protein Cas4 [Cereibacter sphaeroides]|uniref:CRISPR-associated protein Cas4 n=1 Tax=Cereibacter sphaeroides TaxID=1063 RepID=UPI000F54C192|nr:CRISPR-associated protein Cas4 [Cereibacter sphaeroides]AZB54622.1 CRISPR-associated protein Cas4 [Cereibacter sphaeroides]AZB58878.1 CRISPR-associated protein Cas4 [Cereibacter sphaeroides]MWP35994.1 CRISPR-associated protein Cas4 [Cereibacter sphaeroides]